VSVVIPLTTFSGSVNAAGMGTSGPSGETPTALGTAREPLDERTVTSSATETRLTATVHDLGTLGGEDSTATAIDGDIVVGSAMTATGRNHAFAYDLGAAAPTMIDLGTLGGASSEATDVSGDIIVGVSRTESRSHFFYYDLGAPEPTMVDLGIGFAASIYGEPWGPFVDDGVIVGQMDVGARNEEPRAFAYDITDGFPTVVNLGTLGSADGERYSYATAVDAGVVVGASTPHAKYGGPHGFAYDLNATTRHMIDLGAVSAGAVHQRVIVGYRDLPADPWRSRGRAFYHRLDASTPATVLFGPERSNAKAIEGNIVAGSMRLSTGRWHPYAYDLEATPPRLVDLGSLGGRYIGSMGVSGSTVTGTMSTTANPRVFGYDLAAASPVMVDLGTLPSFPRTGIAVDMDGDIVVGSSHARYHQHAVAWTLSNTSAPALEFSRLMYTTPEGDRAATVTVRRTGDAAGAATVGYEAAAVDARANKDFEPISGTLTFAAGETTQTFTVPILDDLLAEDRERIALWLTRPEGGVLGTPQMVALRIGASDIRPDAQVKEQTDQQFVGDNIYNTTGADQTRRLTSPRGKSRTFEVAVCTDNAAPSSRRATPGRFRLHANPAADGSRVRFRRADVDVTATIRSTEGLRLKVRSGTCARVEVRIRIRPTAEIGSKHSAVITSTWDEELLRTDRVKAVVKVVNAKSAE
jgi:probable HAF family extracellular repeat protein